jgi:hypothetical protein
MSLKSRDCDPFWFKYDRDQIWQVKPKLKHIKFWNDGYVGKREPLFVMVATTWSTVYPFPHAMFGLAPRSSRSLTASLGARPHAANNRGDEPSKNTRKGKQFLRIFWPEKG